jgi:hypothetical protein
MELLGLGILVLLILGAVLYAATIPLLWYLIAALLFFLGLVGPGLGCLVFGVLASLRALVRCRHPRAGTVLSRRAVRRSTP